jgi:hypothetical protein
MGFSFADESVGERVAAGLDLLHMNSKQDYSTIPDKLREFKSRISAILGDAQIFDDPEYYTYLDGIEELKIDKSGAVRLKVTTGALGHEFAGALKALLQRLGATKLTVRVTSDSDEDDEEEY